MRPAVSLVAERAVRYLRDREGPVSSAELARAILSTSIADAATATKVLESAFEGDPRLEREGDRWTVVERPRGRELEAARDLDDTRDHTLVLIDGSRPAKGRPFELRFVGAVRISHGRPTEACGGQAFGPSAPELRTAVRDALHASIPVLHDPPGAISALDRWLGEPLPAPVSLRQLGRTRLGLRADHDIETLAARLGLRWTEGAEAPERADLLEAVLDAVRRPGETLASLRAACGGDAAPIPWESYGFDRSFLRSLPPAPGLYRFVDETGETFYVGKARDLRRRVGSYFREGGPRSARVQRLVERVRRIEIEPSGSELEALLREAAEISTTRPDANVQREVHGARLADRRLDSILVLEPAAAPWSLRAYLIRRARLVARVPIGPRGGGLRRIERILETRFFFPENGPTEETPTDVDVELLGRWLAANRDRVVAFDPTDLPSSREVVLRLRWYLEARRRDPSIDPPARLR